MDGRASERCSGPQCSDSRYNRAMPMAAPLVTLSAPRPRRLRRVLAVLAGAAVLAVTFALYLSPDLTLDLGQLMAFCGLR